MIPKSLKARPSCLDLADEELAGPFLWSPQALHWTRSHVRHIKCQGDVTRVPVTFSRSCRPCCLDRPLTCRPQASMDLQTAKKNRNWSQEFDTNPIQIYLKFSIQGWNNTRSSISCPVASMIAYTISSTSTIEQFLLPSMLGHKQHGTEIHSRKTGIPSLSPRYSNSVDGTKVAAKSWVLHWGQILFQAAPNSQQNKPTKAFCKWRKAELPTACLMSSCVKCWLHLQAQRVACLLHSSSYQLSTVKSI